MSTVSFDANVHNQSRSATISPAGSGLLLRTDVGSSTFRTFSQALHAAREYLGPFLASADRPTPPAWGLRVCVSAGCAYYGPNPPRSSGGGGIPAPPAELLAKIRAEYREGDGPLKALSNAVKIARAHSPESDQRAA